MISDNYETTEFTGKAIAHLATGYYKYFIIFISQTVQRIHKLFKQNKN